MSDNTTKNTPAPGPSTSASIGLDTAMLRIADLEKALGMARQQQDAAQTGAIGRFGYWLVGPSWRTSTSAAATLLGTLLFGLVIGFPEMFPAAIAKWAPVLPFVATTFGLRLAKDVQTSGVARPPSGK